MSDKVQEALCKLFVGNLHFKTTDDTLKDYFKAFGEVVEAVVVKDPHSKKSRGFGFVTYKEPSMVDEAQSKRPHKIDDREVQTKRAIPKDQSGRPESQVTVKKIFIGGLKDEVEEEDLKQYFEEYGKIKDVSIAVDKATQKRKGFAFIEFDDHDPVDKIVLLKNHTIKGKSYEVQKALSKQEKENMRASSYGYGGYGGYGSYGGYGDDYWNPWGNDYYGDGYGGGPMRRGSFQRDAPYRGSNRRGRGRR